MLSQITASFARPFTNSFKWIKAKDIDLTKIYSVGNTLHSQGFVTFDMTTNRSHIPGDEIICTPALVNKMNLLLLNSTNSQLPPNHASVTTQVICQHKAPLPMGEHYHITAKARKVAAENAEFDVVLQNDNNQIIGEATIKIGVITF